MEYRIFMFPSPYGDKLQLVGLNVVLPHPRFRPLTGINCNAEGGVR